MFLDKELCFCEEQSVTASAVSQNVINVGEDCGSGSAVRLKVMVDGEDFATLTSLRVGVQASGTEDFALFDTLFESGSIPVADLKQGYSFPLPTLPVKHKAFLRLSFTVTGANATAGKLSGYVIMDDQTNV
ncbi:Bbp16 family capsid cement protein [Maridesulfovibrio sp. FT414]|uniref:Bbp16 family capsid cement protein n=1 Tax=Maridesulfovibrio sp. FT414 TaxID=2979469 RepID=UPI003D803576